MKMVLVPVDGGTPIVVDRAILFFGRGPECDVVLTSSRKVSRKHCCIAQIENRIVVCDLGSMNGVRINDVAIDGQKQLKVGETVWIGDVGYRLAVSVPGRGNAKKQVAASPHQDKLQPVSTAPLIVDSAKVDSKLIPSEEIEASDDSGEEYIHEVIIPEDD